jgi:hypothetical protein
MMKRSRKPPWRSVSLLEEAFSRWKLSTGHANCQGALLPADSLAGDSLAGLAGDYNRPLNDETRRAKMRTEGWGLCDVETYAWERQRVDRTCWDALWKPESYRSGNERSETNGSVFQGTDAHKRVMEVL